MPYFIGFEHFDDREKPFDPFMLVHFRKRLNKEVLMEINEIIAKKATADVMPKKDKDDSNCGNSDGTGANECQNKFEANTSEEDCNDDRKAEKEASKNSSQSHKETVVLCEPRLSDYRELFLRVRKI